MDHSHYRYSPIVLRTPLIWPEGGRVFCQRLREFDKLEDLSALVA